jgi:hypothetical protein
MTKNSYEGPIARARRRAFELGEGCLILAKTEAEQLAQELGRKPSFAEKCLFEHVGYLTVRIRTLRRWEQTREADEATRLLATLLRAFEKKSKPSVAKLLEKQIQ